MKKIYIIIFICIFATNAFSQKVEANWESINSRPYPQWFSEAKLGIFVHWGLYSIPAYCSKEGYSEWYYKGLMVKNPTRLEFHKRVFGENFKYQDFNKLFKAELFNPDQWADIFQKSGAKYVVLVTKHHDGYCLWNSKLAPEWNSVTGGPKRDIVGELTNSVRKTGLKMGFYYSLPEWTNPLHIWTVDPNDSIANYVDNYMIPQFKELVSTYKPSLIFADGDWDNSAEQWHAKELISWYYNLVGEEAIVNNRWGAGSKHGYKTPEYSDAILENNIPWAECRGLGRSFGLNRNEPLENYFSSENLIKHFVKLVAAGGGLTLNVGPDASGQIPLIQQERLFDLGNWLKINGEAIYGTHPYQKHFEMKKVEINKIDTVLSFNWVRNSPDPAISYDNFSAKWTSNFIPPITGEYIFVSEESINPENNSPDDSIDDAVNIELNKKNIIHWNKKNRLNPKSDPIFLEKGKKYPIEVLYSEKELSAAIKISWHLKDSSLSNVLSAENLINDNGEKALSANYSSYQAEICYTKKDKNLYVITFNFPDENIILNIPKASKNAEVFFMDNNKKLKWGYKNSQMKITTEDIKFSEIKSKGAWVFVIKNYFE